MRIYMDCEHTVYVCFHCNCIHLVDCLNHCLGPISLPQVVMESYAQRVMHMVARPCSLTLQTRLSGEALDFTRPVMGLRQIGQPPLVMPEHCMAQL